MPGYGAVLAGRSPIEFERAIRVILKFLGMLLPVRIGHPDGVCGLVILVFDGLKEMIDDALFAPMAECPADIGDQQSDQDRNDDDLLAAFVAARIIFRRLKESHVSLDTPLCR